MEEKFQRKLQMLMKNEGISQSRLAEMLEVKPSTLSHILAGRNYPGFDMLQKLRRLFPHINADWLLIDTSEDYLATAPIVSAASAGSTAADLFSGGNAPDDPATSAARGSFGNTSRSSATVAGRASGTAGSAAGTVGGVDARRMVAGPSLFDPSSMPDGSSAGAGAASSPLSAQTLSSFDRADGLRIRRIIVLYEDNSFESFTPRP